MRNAQQGNGNKNMKLTIDKLETDASAFAVLTDKLTEIGTKLNVTIDLQIRSLDINLYNRVISVDELEKTELDAEYLHDICTLETPDDCCDDDTDDFAAGGHDTTVEEDPILEQELKLNSK